MIVLLRALWKYKFLRFLTVGGINTVFGYSVYLLFLRIGIPYQAAAVAATVIGVVFNFFTTGHVVFENSDLKKIVGFFAVYGITLVVNLVLLTWLVEAGFSKVYGPIVLLPPLVILSFLLNKYLVFGKRS